MSNLKRVFAFFFFAFFFGYLYLVFPYCVSLVKHLSMSGSGMKYLLKEDVTQQILESEKITIIKPKSTQFGLVVSRLGLNLTVAADVDLYDQQELESVLSRGLVQASVSSLPGQPGAVLIVGQPLASFFNYKHLNPDFYLIQKLKLGDRITVFYEGERHLYEVTAKSRRSPDFFDFFDAGNQKKLVLVSGYPPGMAFSLSVIEAEEIF